MARIGQGRSAHGYEALPFWRRFVACLTAFALSICLIPAPAFALVAASPESLQGAGGITKAAQDNNNLHYARSALAKLGADYVAAYDKAKESADGFSGGSTFSASYGKDYGFNMTQSAAVMNALHFDHPEYTWWGNVPYSPGPGGFMLNLQETFSSTTVAERNAQTEAAALELYREAGVCEGMSDSNKAYALYSVLIRHVKYDIGQMDQTAFSALVDGEAVCSGYAMAYTYLLQLAGIQATYVPGDAQVGSTRGGHAWVLALIGGSYYYFDPTLDDGGATPKFKWFGKTTANMSNHWIDDVGYAFPTTATSNLSLPSSTVNVSAVAGAHGKAYPSSIDVPSGSPVAITLVPDAGYSPKVLAVGGATCNPTAQEDGTWVYVIDSVTVNTVAKASFEKELVATTLTPTKETVSVKQGTSAQVSVTLKAGDAPLANAAVSFTCNGSTYEAATGESGTATVEFPSTLGAGTYEVAVRYAGGDDYAAAEATIALTVLADVSYEAGDFVISATNGGELVDGEEWSYSSDDGVLNVFTNRSVTVAMKDGVDSTSNRIVVGNKQMASDDNNIANITLAGVNIDCSGRDAVYSPADAAALSATYDSSGNGWAMNLILVGENELYGGPATYADSCGLYAFTMTIGGSGSLKVVAGTAGNDKTAYGIQASSLTIADGSFDITSDCALSVTGALKINGGRYDLHDAAPALSIGTYYFSSMSIAGGDFALGSADDGTVYGANVASGFKVVERESDGKTWYHVADNHDLLVAGGVLGTDYQYSGDKLEILSEVPLTISMNESVASTDTYISVSSYAGVETAHLTLRDVFIDRSAVLGSSASHAALYAYRVNVDLTLEGASILRGSAIASGYCDSCGIDVEPTLERSDLRTLTIQGSGSLAAMGSDNSGESYMGTYGIKTGNLVVNGGEVRASGNSITLEGATSAGIQATGNVTVKKGSVTCAGGAVAGSTGESYGLYAKGNLSAASGTAVEATGGDAPYRSIGARVQGSFSLNGGAVECAAGNAENAYGCAAVGQATVKSGLWSGTGGEGKESAGLVAVSSLSVSGGSVEGLGSITTGPSVGVQVSANLNVTGGSIRAVGGVSSTGATTGLIQENKSSKVTISGGKVNGIGTKGEIATGVQFSGKTTLSGGTVTAKGGEATAGNSFGIASSDGYAVTVSGATVTATGEQATTNSAGLYADSTVAVTKGTLRATATSTKGKRYGIYTTGAFSTSGGSILAKGTTSPLVCQKSTIKGGQFSSGTVSNFSGKALGRSVASGYIVVKSGNATYPCKVTKRPLPQVGANLADKSGLATYTVTKATTSSITVTYKASKKATATSISVPATVTLSDGNTATVNALGANALKAAKSLKTLTVGNNVKTVGANACLNAKKLTSVTLGTGVTTIGASAFSGCKALKTVTIKGAALKSVGKKAFSGLPNSITVKVPKKQLAKYTKLLKAAGLPTKAKIKGV